jgi:exportin-1
MLQDMAVETLLKICNKCKRKFVQHQPGEARPFVDEILTGIPDIIQDLNTYQTNTFYESVALMIRAEQHDPARDEYLVCSYSCLFLMHHHLVVVPLHEVP